MLYSTIKMVNLCISMALFLHATAGSPLPNDEPGKDSNRIPGLVFLGSTSTKELYITQSRVANFQYALGFGCPYVFGNIESENNLRLAAIETEEEVGLIDHYFAETQSAKNPVEPVWTSGIDRLGNVHRQWASTGKFIDKYPSSFQGDWSPGQGHSPTVADYNCVAIWRYCDRQSHGATIPSCRSIPYSTWFSPRPCHEERRYICERSL